MDFCTSCGFLLPVEMVGKSTKCRSCNQKTPDKHQICQCEYCYSAFSSDRNVEISIACSERKSYKKPRNLAKPRNSRKGGQESHQVIEMDLDDESNDWCQPGHRVEQSPPSWAEQTCDESPVQWEEQTYQGEIQDWAVSGQGDCGWDDNSMGQEDWGDPGMEDDGVYINTHDNDTSGWTEITKKSPRHSTFGQHEFPTLKRGLKESAVEESVRADWERQQVEYKKMLTVKDTAGIARLMSGHRRKANNERYYVGGVDISFIKDNQKDACACLSVVRLPDLELVYEGMEMVELTQLYIPGFLAFREVPFLIKLFHDLQRNAPQYTPDVIMVDGNGILHPKGFGLASQLGVMLNVPTIGVAKTLMNAQGITDDNAHKVKKQKIREAGDGFDLISETGNILGKCVKVHDKAPNPVYVSVGHKISLKSAVWLVLECCKFRIPEPVRRADLDSREYIRQGKKTPEVYIKRNASKCSVLTDSVIKQR